MMKTNNKRGLSAVSALNRDGGPASVSWRQEKGFTLIETIVALSILVVMIGLVLSALRLGQRSMEKGNQALEDATARRFITKRFSSDVTSMYLYLQNSNSGDTYLFHGARSEFDFVTAHHSGASVLPWGGLTFISYSAGKKGLIVREKILPLADDSNKRLGRTVRLGPEVKRVSFSYLGDSGWLKKWNAESEERLPLAVRAEFFFKERAREPLVVIAPVRGSHKPPVNGGQAPKGV